MGFLLFAATMAALAMFSTTKESRAQARQEYAYLKPLFDKLGLVSLAILFSFFF